jgi:hypothetical protein
MATIQTFIDLEKTYGEASVMAAVAAWMADKASLAAAKASQTPLPAEVKTKKKAGRPSKKTSEAPVAVVLNPEEDSATGAAAAAAAAAKPKRQAAPGTLAWMAFVKHCKTSMADLFEGCTKEPERLMVCKTIKSENPEVYQSFVKGFTGAASARPTSEEGKAKED